ncbi:M36 family metallopeptidase [Melioribacter sp. Ez-97]|uniref:M36 family metallopeptidase n=1 Tax=Melioribacter sp. Ez-97 TaxID=3423434 RepID=UPI003ED93C3E
MKIKYFFNVLFTWFSLLVIVHSQVLPTEEQKNEWKKFKKQDLAEWSISWDNRTGTPSFLYGPGISKYKGDAKTIAKNFIEEIIGLFLKTETASNFEISKTKTVNGISHVRFQQNYKGITVYGAQYIVHINKDNEVYLANGKFFRDISINTNAKVKTDDVIKILEKEIKGSIKDLETRTREIVYPKEYQFILAYEVTLRSNRFFNRTYFIDANDGTVIDSVNNICDATGTGNVYLKHPLLTPITTTVSLTNLDGSGYIKGTYADVSTDITYWFPNQPPTPSRAYSTSFNFQYTTTDFRFDEANAYYHISQFRDWLNTNYLSGDVPQLQVYTGIKDEAEVNNAYFSPPNTMGFGLGIGTGYHDFAREDKIIYHEYTHANTYELVELQNGYNESGAISEGIADYFPASYTNRTLAGEYSLYGFTPRSSYPGKQRDVASPLIDSYSRYNDDNDPVWIAAQNQGLQPQESHIGGEFFSSILWDIRSAIGQSVANNLTFQALSLLTTTATFLDFRQAMVAIDQIEYNGSHIPTIETKFNNKGIIAPLNANITGP